MYKGTKYCRTTYRDKHGGLFIYVFSGDTHRLLHYTRRDSFFQLTKPTKRSFYLVFIWIFAAVSYIQKALRPQNYKAGLSHTWQFQAPFQLHVIHEHFCSQTLETSRNFALPVFILGAALRSPQILLRAKNSVTQRRRRTQRMNTTLCDVKSRASDRRQ